MHRGNAQLQMLVLRQAQGETPNFRRSITRRRSPRFGRRFNLLVVLLSCRNGFAVIPNCLSELVVGRPKGSR